MTAFLGTRDMHTVKVGTVDAAAFYHGADLIWTRPPPPLDGLTGTVAVALSTSRYLSTAAATAADPLYATEVVGELTTITQIYDQSGNDRHFTKTVASDRPTIAYGAQHDRRSPLFDGDNDYLEANPLHAVDFIDADNTYIICSILARNIASEEAAIIDNTAIFNEASLNMGLVMKGTIGQNTPQLWGYGRNAANTIIYSDDSFPIDNTRGRVVEWKHANDKLYIRIDGEAWIENAAADFIGVADLDHDFNLVGPGDTANFFNGYVLEMIIFAGTLPSDGDQDLLRDRLLTWGGDDVTWVNWEFWAHHELKQINYPDTMLWFKQCDLGYDYDIRIHPSRTFIRFFLEPGALCGEVASDALFGRSRAEINSPAGGSSHPPDTEFWLYTGHRFRPTNAYTKGYIGQFHDQAGVGDAPADPPIGFWIDGETFQIQLRSHTVSPLPENPAPNVVYEDLAYPIDGSVVLWQFHLQCGAHGIFEAWRSDNDGVDWTKVVDEPDIAIGWPSMVGIYYKTGGYFYGSAGQMGIDIVMPKLELSAASDYMNNPIVPLDVAWDY